jgi:hypothetical protein
MVVLGLLLILGCTAVGVDAVVENTAAIHSDIFGQTVSVTPGAIFLVGAGVGLLFCLGIAMMVDGTRRRAYARRSTKENQQLREHNAQLEQRLDEERTSNTAAYPNEPAEQGSWRDRKGLRGKHRESVQ